MIFSVIVCDYGNESAEVMALVQRVRDGDLDAFRVIMERYAPQVQRLIVHRVRNANDLHDVQQEIFIRLFKALPTFRGDASLFSLIYRIAVRVCANEHKAAKQLPSFFADQSPTDERETQDWQQRYGESAEEAVLRHERQLTICHAISELHAAYRDVFVLSEIEGYSD
jgi:RNA polymerase sigma-70 factor (ECF subfamily)